MTYLLDGLELEHRVNALDRQTALLHAFLLLAITRLIDCAGRQPQPARLLAPLFVRYFIQ